MAELSALKNKSKQTLKVFKVFIFITILLLLISGCSQPTGTTAPPDKMENAVKESVPEKSADEEGAPYESKSAEVISPGEAASEEIATERKSVGMPEQITAAPDAPNRSAAETPPPPTLRGEPSAPKKAYPEQGEPRRVERFPTMEAPGEVDASEEFALQVSLTEDLITPDVKIKAGEKTEDGKLRLNLPHDQKSWALDVVISAPAFNLKGGKNRGRIELPLEGDSSPALFYLQAKAIEKSEMDARVYATLWYNGVYLAKIVKEIKIVKRSSAIRKTSAEDGERVDLKASVNTNTGKDVGLGGEIEPVALDFSMQQADLTVYILENLDPDSPLDSEVIIASPYLQPTMHKFRMPRNYSDWIESKYSEFVQETIRVRTSGGAAAQGSSITTHSESMKVLEDFGDELYDKFAPEAFKEAFWRLSDKLGDRFDTIQIFSNNPVVPWELMRPRRSSNEKPRPYMGMDFVIGRWHVSDRSRQLDRPPQTLKLNELVVVAPGYSKDALPAQKIEMNALRNVPGYRELPGRFNELSGLFNKLPQGIIHFAGHGQVKRIGGEEFEYTIGLEDGALDSNTWRKLIAPERRANPFFFFNACEIGQARKTADFVTGWAPAVLEAGASGFVGALWPIDDLGAADFASVFYSRLVKKLKSGPVKIADLVKETRGLFLDKGNPTYMSYVYYGDPNLMISIK